MHPSEFANAFDEVLLVGLDGGQQEATSGGNTVLHRVQIGPRRQDVPRNLDGLAKRKFGALIYFTWRTIRDASASPNATNVQNVFRSIIFFLHQCVIASRSSRLQPLTEIPGIGLGNKIVAIESCWFGTIPSDSGLAYLVPYVGRVKGSKRENLRRRIGS